MGAANPGSFPVNFHGSFSATSKVATAQDLGLPVGTLIFVSSISLEYSASAPTILAVSVADFATSGVLDVDGPRSSNRMAVDGSVGRIAFRNPNSTLYWPVADASDAVCTIHSSNASSVVTFSGTLQIRIQGAPSHTVS